MLLKALQAKGSHADKAEEVHFFGFHGAPGSNMCRRYREHLQYSSAAVWQTQPTGSAGSLHNMLATGIFNCPGSMMKPPTGTFSSLLLYSEKQRLN